MLGMFRKNPLTMRGMLTRCWLFTYQTPADEARRLLPPQLEPATHHGCAFWNVVVCRMQAMRLDLFPAFVGVRYWHVAYRLYVRFHPARGKPIEGLYFLRSDCDSRLMTTLGNLFTDFNFHTAKIMVSERDQETDLKIESPDAPAQARLRPADPPQLAPHSAFDSLDEAAAFLKYQPCGISINAAGNANIVHIVRREDAWRSRLVHVAAAHWSFFDDKNVRPEICYEVEPIAYQWNRGRIYRPVCQSLTPST